MKIMNNKYPQRYHNLNYAINFNYDHPAMQPTTGHMQ